MISIRVSGRVPGQGSRDVGRMRHVREPDMGWLEMRFLVAKGAFLGAACLALGCSRSSVAPQDHMGLGPHAFTRVTQVDRFVSHLALLTHLRIEGGGYRVECASPRADQGMDLLTQCYNMAEAEGPVHVWVDGLSYQNRRVVLKKLDFGFDPRLGRNSAVTGSHIEELRQLRQQASQPVGDARLEAIGDLLYRVFDTRSATVDSLRIQVSDEPARTISDPSEIARVLMALGGSHATGPKLQRQRLTVRVVYRENGGAKVLTESFGIDESLLSMDGTRTSIGSLAADPARPAGRT